MRKQPVPLMPHFKSLLVLVLCLGALISLHAGTRQSTLLNTGWIFQSGEVSNAIAADLDASTWQQVVLPHCWGWQEAQVSSNYYRGPGCYRRELEIQPREGQRYFVRFEAASLVTDVYLNGHKLGQHRGGFGAFCYELTPVLSPSGRNLLAVRVSNAPESDIAPLSGDFCVFGGLYRPAHLLNTADVCFTPVDHASLGVSWQQAQVSNEAALVDFTAEISNESKTNAHRVLVARILDAEGRVVASQLQPITVPLHMTAPFHLQLAVKNPHLWNGRADPYLYRAVAELQETSGSIGDSVEQSVGLRWYRVDPDKGFFLNGQPYRLRGVCRHQDVWDKGWALSAADHERDLQLICEMGANAVRCAHYQHSDDFYSLCDRAGLLVWAEIPQVNEVRTSPEFFETSRNQLLDLIRQSENHPSIFCWSIFNEIGNGHTEDPHRLLQDLQIVAHGEDPTRPVIGATCISSLPQMNAIPDLLGWNKYPGWYSNKPEDCGSILDGLRYTSRHGGFCLSEYGAGANPFQHELPARQPAKTAGQWHPEEWQCVVHEADWAAIQARPFVWGSFVWNMFDFVVAGRHEGGVPSRNDKGLVTSDRQLKKDAFYFYQANWSDQPVLHINSQRFTERTNAVTDIKVYSNARAVELWINGVSLGTRKSEGNAAFVWKECRLRSGENLIEARAQRNGLELQDHCRWHFTEGGNAKH